MLALLRTSLLFALTACVVNEAAAETVKAVDLRSQTEGPEEFYVILCARKSAPWGTGHCFVIAVHYDPFTRRVCQHGFGFYPREERVVWRLFQGRGAVEDETTKWASIHASLLTHRLIVRVNREQYLACLQVKEQWAAAGYHYNLLTRNCTHFAYAVAHAIGLHPPKPKLGQRPPDFLECLMELDAP